MTKGLLVQWKLKVLSLDVALCIANINVELVTMKWCMDPYC